LLALDDVVAEVKRRYLQNITDAMLTAPGAFAGYARLVRVRPRF